MFWSTPALAGTLVVLGDAPFRAPDGVADVALADDGRAVVLSPNGELARFDAAGRLQSTLQACPDRMPRIQLAASARLERVGVACSFEYRLHDLAGGRPGPVLAYDVTHSALSADGRRVGLLGERMVGGASEDASALFEIDTLTGEVLRRWPGEWDHVVAVPGGWVVARGDDDGTELTLQGFVALPGRPTIPWRRAIDPAKLRGGGWTTETTLSTRDDLVCVTHDNGGTCFDAARGAVKGSWRPDDRPFVAPGPRSLVHSPRRRRTLEVRRTHLRRPGSTFGSWTRPRDVDFGRGTLLVTDEGGTVHRVHDGAVEVVLSTRGDAALSPDGTKVWAPSGEAGLRMDLGTGALVRVPPLDHAAFGPDGSVYGLRGQVLVQQADDGTVSELGRLTRLFEPTGLEVTPDGLLVDFGQDDHFAVLDRSGATRLQGSHVFHSTEDLALVDGAPLETRTAQAPATREVGPPGASGRSLDAGTYDILRLFDDGRLVVVEADGPGLTVLSPSGEEIARTTLPTRAYDVWVGDGRVVVGLRDGRLAVFEP